MSESVLWLHPAIACVHADIMLHRIMRPVAASPGAISDTYTEGNGDYPQLCRYNVAPGNAIGGSIFGVRSRGGLGSFTSTFGGTYVGGMMLLWRHRAGVCVPADPASVGQCQLWPRHRAGDHEGRGTCANLFRAKRYLCRRVAAIIGRCTAVLPRQAIILVASSFGVRVHGGLFYARPPPL